MLKTLSNLHISYYIYPRVISLSANVNVIVNSIESGGCICVLRVSISPLSSVLSTIGFLEMFLKSGQVMKNYILPMKSEIKSVVRT